MDDYSVYVGSRIRNFRKAKNWSIQKLADTVCKSKATISKYEKGQITIDVESLRDIALALDTSPDQLLYYAPDIREAQGIQAVPTFFIGLDQLYMYYFDGRNNSISRSVIELGPRQDDGRYIANMYMSCSDLDHYQRCENTYTGYVTHYDALTRLVFQNRDTPMEQFIINVLAAYLDAPYKWTLNYGLSSRPFMPIALKACMTKKPAAETADFKKALRINKEDIRLLKQYNMMTCMG